MHYNSCICSNQMLAVTPVFSSRCYCRLEPFGIYSIKFQKYNIVRCGLAMGKGFVEIVKSYYCVFSFIETLPVLH